MCLNWKPENFLVQFKHCKIKTSQVKLGDIATNSIFYWQIAEIRKDNNGKISLLDIEGKGMIAIDEDKIISILDRSIFKQP